MPGRSAGHFLLENVMKNSELLNSNKRSLSPLAKQRRYLLRCLVQKNACPNCGHRLNFFEAAKIDIDSWQGEVSGLKCNCSACNRQINYVVPFLAVGGSGGWQWHLEPIKPDERR